MTPWWRNILSNKAFPQFPRTNAGGGPWPCSYNSHWCLRFSACAVLGEAKCYPGSECRLWGRTELAWKPGTSTSAFVRVNKCDGWSNGCPKGPRCPNPWHLWMGSLPPLAKGTQQLCSSEQSPGGTLSWIIWMGPDITRQEGVRVRARGRERPEYAVLSALHEEEEAASWSCRQTLEAGKGEEMCSPGASPKECSPANSSILAHREHSELWPVSCKIMNLCAFKPLSFYWCVTGN